MRIGVNKSYLTCLCILWFCLATVCAYSEEEAPIRGSERMFQYVSENIDGWCRGIDTDFKKTLLTFSHVCQFIAEYQAIDLSGIEALIAHDLAQIDVWIKDVRVCNILTIEDLSKYYFQTLAMDVDAHDPKGHNSDNLFLNKVISRRKGNCLSLSVLYLFLSEPLNMGVYPVLIPGHFMLGVSDGGTDVYIETTLQGQLRTQSQYSAEFSVPAFNEVYFRGLSKTELLGVYLNNLGNVFVKKNLLDIAKLLYERAKRYIPGDSSVYMNLATVSSYRGEFEKEMSYFQKASELNPLDIQIKSNMAASLVEKSQYTLAYTLLMDLGDALGHDANYWYKVAYCAIFLEKWDKAHMAIEAFGQLESKDSEDFYYLKILYFLRQGKWFLMVQWMGNHHGH